MKPGGFQKNRFKGTYILSIVEAYKEQVLIK